MSKAPTFAISFSQVICEKCKGTREAKSPCPECGAKPAVHETQPAVEKRQRLVAFVREHRIEVTPTGFPLDYLDELVDAGTGVEIALAKSAENPRDEAPLLGALARLDQLVADTSIERLRPHRNAGRRVHDVVAGTRDALEFMLDALAAPTMKIAQDLERQYHERMQFLIAKSKTLEDRDADRREGQDSASILEALGLEHGQLARLKATPAPGRNTSFAVDSVGRDLGVKTAIEVIDTGTESLDRDRVRRLSDDVSSLLSKSPRSFQPESVRADLVLSSTLLEYRASQLLRLADSGEPDILIVQSAVDFAAMIRERGLRILLAILLDAAGLVSYEETSTWKSGAVIKRANDQLPIDVGLDSHDRVLRDAAGHQDFTVVGDEVHLNQGKLALSADEFIDRVLQSYELHQGLLRGTLVALQEAGLPLPPPDQISARQRSDTIAYALAFFGLTNATTTVVREAIRLTADGQLTDWPGLVATVLELVPHEAETMSLNLRNGSSERHFSANLSLYRGWQSWNEHVDSFEFLWNYLTLATGLRIDGQCPVEEEAWFSFALHAGKAESEYSLTDRVRRVNRVKRLMVAADVNTDRVDLLLQRLRRGTEAPALHPSKAWLRKP